MVARSLNRVMNLDAKQLQDSPSNLKQFSQRGKPPPTPNFPKCKNSMSKKKCKQHKAKGKCKKMKVWTKCRRTCGKCEGNKDNSDK